VGLASRLVLECVEDPERRVVDAEAVPDPRSGLLFDDRLTALDERLDLRFLAGLRLDQRQDPKGECHVAPPCDHVRLGSTTRMSARPAARVRRTPPLHHTHLEIAMAEVLLFHHAQGLTPGVVAFADELRAAGHTVHTPDLFDGRTFGSIDEGMAFIRGNGMEELAERGERTADDLPNELVYAGFSFGEMIAQKLAQTRPGAKGALLFYSAIPISGEWAFGPWPDGVPVQIHGMDNDPIFVGEGDIEAAREIVADGRRRGALPLPRRPALLRGQLAALVRPGRRGIAHEAGARVPGARLT
jgi:hypothetical protein